jgi:hypothetical protein
VMPNSGIRAKKSKHGTRPTVVCLVGVGIGSAEMRWLEWWNQPVDYENHPPRIPK